MGGIRDEFAQVPSSGCVGVALEGAYKFLRFGPPGFLQKPPYFFARCEIFLLVRQQKVARAMLRPVPCFCRDHTFIEMAYTVAGHLADSQTGGGIEVTANEGQVVHLQLRNGEHVRDASGLNVGYLDCETYYRGAVTFPYFWNTRSFGSV